MEIVMYVDREELDWQMYGQSESLHAEADDIADANADAVLAAKKGSELLPTSPYAYIKTVYDVANDLAAGDGEDADLVGNAIFLATDGWEEAETRAAFDALISTRRDVIEAVARHAHKLTMEVLV